MAKNVDNPAHRDAMRAQQASKIQQTNTGKGMNIGVQQPPSQFGQILQDQMNESRPRQSFDDKLSEEESNEERPTESRKPSRSKEGAQQHQAHEKVRERQSRQESREDRDQKDEGGGSERKESTQKAKEAEQRVVSKEGRGGQSQSHSGQGGQQGAGQQSKGQSQSQAKGQPEKATQQQQAKEAPKSFVNQAAATTSETSGTTQTAASAPLPKAIPQRILDQIVSYARLVTRKGGETEMELALRDEVFKGLRMRISTKNGKISATFVTSSKDVRDLFNNEKRALNHELTEKGLAVESIDVIMT